MQHLGQPVDEQKQVHQAAKVDDPQQRGLQRVALAEEHLDRIAAGEVEELRIGLPAGDPEAIEECRLPCRQIHLAREKARRFRQPQTHDRQQDEGERAAEDEDDRPAEAHAEQ